MSGVNDLLEELNEIAQLNQARIAQQGQDSTKRVANALGRSIATKVACLHSLGPKDLVALQDSLSKCMFDESVMDSIYKAIDNKLMNIASPSSTKPALQKTQNPLSPQNFMPQSVVDLLSNPLTGTMEAEEAVCSVLRRLGVSCASVQTRKWVVALLVTFECQRTHTFPDYQRIYEDIQRFPQVLASCGQLSDGVESLQEYPSSPAGLPDAIWRQAYTAEDQPVELNMPRISVVANNHVPLRDTNKLLQTKQSPSKQSPSRRGLCDDDVLTLSRLR